MFPTRYEVSSKNVLRELSIVVGVLVLGLKFLAWRWTGSVALYSDALESIVNVVAAGAMYAVLRVVRQPPDEGHSFGHGKAEYLSAVLEASLVMSAAIATLQAALPKLAHPDEVHGLEQGLPMSVLASILNGALAWHLKRTGKQLRSVALEADAAHLFSDVATSMGVLVGVLLARLTGWKLLDPLLASAVALHILWIGAGLLRRSVGGLMDEALDPETRDQVKAGIEAEARRHGAHGTHDFPLPSRGSQRLL